MRTRHGRRLSRIGAAAVLLACGCWVRVAAEMCDGGALAEFERCIGDCEGYTCLSGAFSGDASCNVLVSLDQLQGDSLLPAEGVWQMQCAQDQRCDNLRSQIAEDPECCPQDASPSEYFAVCPNGLPSYTCSVECAPTVLYFWHECAELYQNHTVYTALSNDGLETIPLLTALENSAALCQDTVYREGARAIYEQLYVYYFPFAGWIILMVPFFFCLLFVFFGRHLSSLFRMTVGSAACSMQILWPALAPFITRCGIGITSERVAAACEEETPPITASVVFDIAFATLIAMVAGYTCRQLVAFGNAVQGFTLGFVLATWTTDLWIGGITQNMSMDFVVLAISALFGTVGAAVNIFFPVIVNMLGSAIIGSFACCQIFCIIGYFNDWQATFPVSLLAAGLGVAGCDSTSCYLYLLIWVALAGLGVAVQRWSSRIEVNNTDNKPETVTERLLFKLRHGFKVLLDMEASISEHAEYHSKEEMQELADQHAATWAAAATAISHVCLLCFGTSLVVCGAELLYRGVYTSMLVYLVFTGLLALLFTVHQMQVHNDVTVAERVRQFDVYIWGIFICVPFAATGFFVCLSLGLDADPLGLHDDFGVDKIHDVQSSDGSTTFRTFFMRHMQTAMVSFFGLAISSAVTCIVVSKNLGGVLYLMRKIHKFVTGLLLVYGAVIAYVGFGLVPAEQFTGLWIYQVVGSAGVLMIIAGVVGVTGSFVLRPKPGGNRKESCLTKNVMPMFVGLLFIILALNLVVFLAAGLWASSVNVNVAEDWSHINSTMAAYCEARDVDEPCHLTQDEFAARVLASLQLAMAIGIVTSAYMMAGLIAALYMAVQSAETLSNADELVQKHAKEYLGSLEASEKRKKKGKAGKKKKKKKKRVKMEQDANGEWTATVDPPPPPDGFPGPPDGDPPPPPPDGFPGPPYGDPPPPPPDGFSGSFDGDPPPPPPASDEQVENPVAAAGPRRIGTRTLGKDRVYTKVEKKAIARQQKQLAKLQAQQKKRDARNAKAAAKREAKREKEDAKAGKSENSGDGGRMAAASVATFDMEDAPMEAFAAEDDDEAAGQSLKGQVGQYQWVTDSDAESEYESDEEYQYHTTDSDRDDV